MIAQLRTLEGSYDEKALLDCVLNRNRTGLDLKDLDLKDLIQQIFSLTDSERIERCRFLVKMVDLRHMISKKVLAIPC